MLQHAKTRREAIGVELYNFQQQLAKMQMQLEKAQENYAYISQIRQQAEEQLHSLQKTHAEEEQFTSQERLKVVFCSLSCLEMQYCVCAPLKHCIPYSVQMVQTSSRYLKSIKRRALLLFCRAVGSLTKSCQFKACCISHKEPVHSLLSFMCAYSAVFYVCISANYTQKQQCNLLCMMAHCRWRRCKVSWTGWQPP